MKKYLLLFTIMVAPMLVNAQEKDTLEVQKVGDRYFIVVDHAKRDSAIQAAVKTATTPRNFDSHFMVAGLGTLGFVSNWTKTTSGGASNKTFTNSFGNDPQFEFSPMFIWRHSNKLLIEFEPSFNGSSLGVNWACMSYFVRPGIILRGGYFVLPFGIYNKRLAAGWINKLATDPIGVTSSPATSDWGIEMEGGLPFKGMKFNYDIAVTNGFQLLNDGTVQNPGIVDNNIGKTVSGRLGWLPLSNSSLELGVSGLYGKAGDANSKYKGTSTYMWAGDVQYIYSSRHAVMSIKGQYNGQFVDRQDYANPNDSTLTYTFTNLSMGYFGQLSVRPVVSSKVLRNLEFTARYSSYETPKNSSWENSSKQISVGVAYWINWRTVFKVTYENLTSTNPLNENLSIADNKTVQNLLYASFSVQF